MCLSSAKTDSLCFFLGQSVQIVSRIYLKSSNSWQLPVSMRWLRMLCIVNLLLILQKQKSYCQFCLCEMSISCPSTLHQFHIFHWFFIPLRKKTCQEASKSNASKKALSEGISPTAASSLVFATMQSAWNLSGVQENSGRFRIHPQNCASVWHKWNAEIGCRGVRQDSPCLRINGRRTSASR